MLNFLSFVFNKIEIGLSCIMGRSLGFINCYHVCHLHAGEVKPGNNCGSQLKTFNSRILICFHIFAHKS
jgi:hypothetical protein